MKKKLSFAVIGAGNCGQAVAADLLSKNFSVNLYNRSKQRLWEIEKNQGIEILHKGRYQPNIVSMDIKKCVKDVDYIIVTTPASAHEDVAHELAPFLDKQHKIVLCPGRTFGAFHFLKTLRDFNVDEDIVVVESQSTFHTARVIRNGLVDILAEKKNLWIASLPSKKIDLITTELRSAFPNILAVDDTLVTGLSNIGAVLHPTPTLFNIGWIEHPNSFFKYYYDAISPTIARFLEKIDNERLTIANVLAVKTISILEWMQQTYGVKAEKLYDALIHNQSYSSIDAPKTIYHRYIFEDIPTGLVPYASLGKIFDVDTTNCELIINQASHIFDIDFWKSGRTMESLGLHACSIDRLKEIIKTGQI
jgi:opine dehydrogenase